ncbi:MULTISPECIES: APC family permease [Spiroplasma]|uniref:APC family permease n=1 Tax=Spiroplasma TaxID=2132 RepID=UPI0018DD2380|nr:MULTISPECIES: APC family permease [Spiroplasma]MBH8622427.1 APC family permease [Spiroplasma sp. hyd1]UNF61463.1 APC family permease [Spiroplasma poulsonii]
MGKTKKYVKFFEFLTVFSTAVGITIGIGIYLKNDTSEGHVLYFTQNPYLAIALWILVGILGIAMIMVFIEIASINTKSGNGTLASWANVLIGRKVGSLFSIFYIFFYFPILLGIFPIFSINAMFDALEVTSITKGTQNAIAISVGSILLILFYLLNIFLRNVGKWVQTIGTFVKFIPLVVSLILGFIIPMSGNVFDTFKELKFGNFFMGLLPVLFSFDGFIYAAGLQKEVSNKNVVPKALFVAMVFITVFYLIQVISLFLGTNDGSVFSLFNNIISGPIARILTWFIVITALMSINGLTFVSPALGQTVQDERLVYIGKRELSYQQIGLIQMTITVSFNLIIMETSLAVKDDPLYLLDISSNAVSFVAFICYISLIVAVWVNRYTKRVEVTKVKGMYYYAGFAIFLLVVSICYIIYSFVAFKSNHNTLYSLIIIVGGSLILWGINELLLSKTAPPVPYQIKTPMINKINQ